MPSCHDTGARVRSREPLARPCSVLCLGVALLAAAWMAAPAAAFAPQEPAPAADLVVTPAVGVSFDELTPADRAVAQRAMTAFSRSTASRWDVLSWSPASLTPRLAAGTGLEVGSPVTDRTAAESAARAFVTSHPRLFRTDPARLGALRVREGLGKWSVEWQETIGGIPILQSRVQVLLTEEGRVAAFGASTFPTIVEARRPSLSGDDAGRAARNHLAMEGLLDRSVRLSRLRVEGPFVLPARSARPGAAGVEGHTIWRVSLSSRETPASFQVDVDALTGNVLQRINTLRTLTDFEGTAHGEVENPNWCAGAFDLPAPRLFVTVTGAGTDTTGADGTFRIPFSGSSPETLRAEMRGAFCDINNVAGDQASFAAEITPGVPFSLFWDGTNSREDERDTYYHVTTWHDRLKSADPDWLDMDFPLPANVNLQQSCNAFWDGEAINMFHEQGGCANTGRIGDVIVHEYTHGITDFLYGPDDPPSDVHEGNSDVAGNFHTNNPVVGPGFYLDDCINGIRDSDNDLRWPEDLQGEGHWDGQILAGFHWHTREALIAQLGYDEGAAVALNLWHFARVLGLPMTQPEQVWWNFLADDDDGNLDNGTPRFDALCQAAARHGFSCPEVFQDVVIHHARMFFGSSPDEEPIPVRAVIYSLAGPMNPDSLLVFYRPAGAGAFSDALFQPTGEEDGYQALIPGQPMGSTIEYYMLAVDAAGNRLTRPGTPGEYYTFQVAYNYDDFELESGWTVGAPGDDATTGIWERCDPNGTYLVYPLQPGDDATPDPGHLCWITGQYTGGYPYNTDADGVTTLLSPIYDLTGMTWATVRYDRWFQSLNGSYGLLDVWISYDAGAHWRVIDRVEGLDPDARWYPIEKVVTPQFGALGQTQFKVVCHGEPVYSITEGGFDDFVLMADDQGAPGAVESAAARNGVSLRLTSSNPSGAFATFEATLPAAGPAALTLYRVDGTVIRTLARRAFPAGTSRLAWDGSDASGRPVASGVYFAKFLSVQGADVRRVILVR